MKSNMVCAPLSEDRSFASDLATVVAAQRAPVGVVRRAIYCDESGIGGNLKHYGFGAIFMGYQRRGEFVAKIRELQQRYRRPDDEIKWNKFSKSHVAFYEALVDYFFAEPGLFFHCMVVERAWVDIRKYHSGSYDLARRKHFTQFLSNKLKRIAQVHHGREIWTKVYVDKLPSSYNKANEAIQVIANRSVQKAASLGGLARSVGPIDAVQECDSKDQFGIQLCDLMLGAVIDAWNCASSAAHKEHLKSHIAAHLGWPDLRSDTRPQERKFNIWWLTDQHKVERPVKTRDVKLRKPLPPLRLYMR